MVALKVFENVESERDLYREILRLGDEDSLESFASRALELIVKVTDARQGYLEVRTGPGDEVWSMSQGFSDDELHDVRARISSGIVAKALASGETIQSHSALLDDQLAELESVRRLQIEAVLCAPIGGSGALGVVYLQGRAGDSPFSDDNREQIEHLASRITPLVDRFVLRQQLADAGDATRELRRRHQLDGLAGRSAAFARALEQAMLAAPLEVNVLITGENGTGKSQLARAIHDNSRRGVGPFLELNCGAIPETLIESELFGAEAGAFTEARATRDGLVAAAAGGTLFLDEIAEIPYSAQSKLLTLIQSREYFRLGNNQPLRADVRIIAATNTDLEKAVDEKRFREDLYFRLKVLPVALPPLEERRCDIPLLAESLLTDIAERNGLDARSLSSTALRWLRCAEWPGNVRQLENDLEAAAIRAHSERASRIEVEHLVPDAGDDERRLEPQTYQEATQQFQRRFLLDALEVEGWNITRTAKRLGLVRQHVHNLIGNFGISKPNR